MRSVVRPLVSVTTYRRWTFLLGGTALLVPYLLIYAGLVQIMRHVSDQPARGFIDTMVMLAAFIVISGSVAFIPAVRVLCRTAAETLLGVSLPEETPEGLRSWRSRRRTAVWWLLHIGVGGTTGFAVVAGLPMMLFLLETPFLDHEATRRFLGHTWVFAPSWSVPAALLTLPAIGYLGAGVGALFARLAPLLLGPSAADRLAHLERRAESLMERNRLARELHDSVGHALTVTTLQAGAAGRVLDSDPEFVRRALAAIEETGRAALADLDHVLGLLREESAPRGSREGSAPRAPQRTLGDLPALLSASEATGVPVRASVPDHLTGVPAVVSREAYRIVQECLTNALRHAGRVPVTLRLRLTDDELELELTNKLSTVDASTRPTGGRGLAGIAERVALLSGTMTAAPTDGDWRVAVRLPLGRTS